MLPPDPQCAILTFKKLIVSLRTYRASEISLFALSLASFFWSWMLMVVCDRVWSDGFEMLISDAHMSTFHYINDASLDGQT